MQDASRIKLLKVILINVMDVYKINNIGFLIIVMGLLIQLISQLNYSRQ